MRNRLLLSWIILLTAVLPCTAQSYKLADQNVVPPSPTSSVYRQFTGWTPDLSTGAATMDFPLYDVTVGNWHLPFSLKYYTTGVKVHATPYPAGYGWSFLPGLRITRVIQGRDDFRYDRDIRTVAEATFNYEKSAVYDAIHGTHGLQDSDMVDTQYDLFTVSLPTESARFILVEENGGYRAETLNSLLKIEILGSGAGFKVTDGAGVVYWFGDGSSTPGFNYTEYANSLFPTSWMLRKVVLPGTGNEVTFTWQSGNSSGLGYGYWLGSHVIRDLKPVLLDPDTFDDATVLGTLEGTFEYPTLLFLKSVDFPGGSISFTYESQSVPLLTGMTVKNVNQKTVRKATLGYGPSGLEHALLKTLNLTGEGTYSFTYYGSGFTNIYAQDWWGYCNGKSNTSLVPQISIRVYPGEYASGEYHTYGYADRSINATAMKTNALKRVSYPGGGYTEYEYEPHRFDGEAPTTDALGPSSRIALTEGAGLRVKKITTCGNDDAPNFVRTYTYGSGDNGKGNVRSLPTPDTFIGEYYGYVSKQMGALPEQRRGFNFRMLYLNTQSNYDHFLSDCPDVWYDTVTETLGDGSRTVYSFTRPVSDDIVTDTYIRDFAARTVLDRNAFFGPGCVLTEKKEYASSSAGGGLKRNTSYTYETLHESDKDVSGLIVIRKEVSLLSNGPDFLFNSSGHVVCPEGTLTLDLPVGDYLPVPARIHFRYTRLKTVTQREYTSEGSVTETETYTYSGPLVASKTVTGGAGDIRKEAYLYPASWSQAISSQQSILHAMYDLNMKSMPFQTTFTSTVPRTGGSGSSITVTDKVRTEYALFGGTNLYMPSKIVQIRDGITRSVREYGYDARGNLRTSVAEGGDKTTWIWAYGSLHPVMEVSGKTYDEVRSAATTQVDQLPAQTDSPTIQSLTGTIRSALGSSASARSFTWEPLAGLLSETDSQGWKTSYQYDTEWRLLSVRGGDGNLQTRYGYHRRTDAAMSVSFSVASTYEYGSTVTFTASGQGGTGHATYKWTLKDASGTTIYTSSASENPSCGIALNQQGTMTLTCTMTDLLTGGTATCQRTFTVSPPSIRFTNVSTSAGHATGTISLSGSAQITLYLDYMLGYGLEGSAMVAGTLYEFTGGSSQVIQATVNGTASFTLSITNSGGGSSSGEITLAITGVPSGYTIGSPSSITASY